MTSSSPTHRSLRRLAAGVLLAGSALLLPATAAVAGAAPSGADSYGTRTTAPPPPTAPGGFTTRTPDLPDLTVSLEDLVEEHELGSGTLHLSEALDQDLFVTVNVLNVDTDPWDWACSIDGGIGCDGFVDVTIPAGDVEAEFEVLAAVDGLAEPTEQFGVTLSVWDTDVVDVGDDAFALLYDADGIHLSVADAEAVEGDAGDGGVLEVVVTSSSAAPVAIDVDVATGIVGFGATPGVDHVALDTTVTIPAGETEVVVEVEVIGDDVVEPDELLFLTISDPSLGSIDLSDTTALGRILDDDADPGVIGRQPAPWIKG
jgi:hypothetical protein